MKLLLPLVLIWPAFALAEGTATTAVETMQRDWAVVNYQLKGEEQEKAFVELLAVADGYVEQYPQEAPVLIWRGIINSTYAGVSGGLGALGYAKAAKVDLERALELDPQALNGWAYTSLGTLYFNVPGWPIGFGDDEKAEELLKKALSINPDGIDPNYFYADYLISEKRYSEAKPVLLHALEADPRPGREVADEGRIGEIDAALAEIEKRL
jgi:tetratricopeptide (TPR) repeat protein